MEHTDKSNVFFANLCNSMASMFIYCTDLYKLHVILHSHIISECKVTNYFSVNFVKYSPYIIMYLKAGVEVNVIYISTCLLTHSLTHLLQGAGHYLKS
jgi:hypothetical protein